MEFTLNSDLVEQIIFAMEDQQNEYYVHRNSGELLRADEIREQELRNWIDHLVLPSLKR